VLPSSQQVPNDDDEVVEVEPEEPVKILEINGTFEDLVVWGHEALPAADDTFVKGVEEWLQFAEAVCSFVFIFFSLVWEGDLLTFF
jgi:ribonuclease H2 subunit C